MYLVFLVTVARCSLFHRARQAKYDLLSSKFSADTVRQRLKYDSLAGRHLELQAEYESLLKDYKIQQRASRARSLPKVSHSMGFFKLAGRKWVSVNQLGLLSSRRSDLRTLDEERVDD